MRTWSAVAKACFGLVAFAGLGLGSIAGCSSDDNTVTPGVDAGLVCPTTVADVGKACTVEGKVCPTGYTCGSFNQQAQCSCTNGHFACTDQTGAPIEAGGTPNCVPNGNGNDKQCPATESAADTAKCTTAGLICRYTGLTCSGASQPLQDVCMCAAPATGPGLVFRCEPSSCNPSSDASIPDRAVPPVDASDSAVPPKDANVAVDAPAEGG